MIDRAFLSFALARIGYFSVVQMTRSSANKALDTLRRSGKSLIKMRNNVQLKAEPWGRPSSSVSLDEVVLSTVVCMVLSVRKEWIHLNILPWIPMLLIFTKRPFLHTLSYACWRSMKTAKVDLLSWKP